MADKNRKNGLECFLMGLWFLAAIAFVLFVGVAWQNQRADRNLQGFHHVLSYEDIYPYYKYYAELRRESKTRDVSDLIEVGGSFAGTDGAAEGDEQRGAVSYAGTDLQEKKVGMGDYSVTDGKYLYTAFISEKEEESDLNVTIHQLDGEQVTLTGKMTKEYGEKWSVDNPILYVYGDVLVVTYTARYNWDNYWTAKSYAGYGVDMDEIIDTPEDEYWDVYTDIEFYDISDPGNMRLLNRQVQNGKAQECLEVDGCLFVISANYDISLSGMEQTERYVPMINEEKMALQDIYMQEEKIGDGYEIISAWDLSTGGRRLVDAKAFVGSYGSVYMTEKNLYLCGSYQGPFIQGKPVDHTRIVKLSCEKGMMQMAASTTLPGRQGTPFSMQESGNELWVTVEVWNNGDEYSGETRSVGVYALDENLKELDYLYGLAEYENLRAVRYVGQTGYFVSFKTLFRVDFSDSRHLKVLDELEMPGYSGYLHPVEEDLLLGVGASDDRKLKVDLYDVSDPRELTRLQKVQLEADSYTCSLLENCKWVLVDEENQLFGFSAREWDEEDEKEIGRYYLYHYDRKDGLKLVKEIELEIETGTLYGYWKGFRVGEYLYLVEYGAEKDNILVESL